MRQAFYNGSKASIIVYDLSRPETLESIETWYKDIAEFLGDIPIIIFGNKTDLIGEEGYDETAIQDLISKYNFLGFYKTSAKTGDCVETAFNAIINVLVNQNMAKEIHNLPRIFFRTILKKFGHKLILHFIMELLFSIIIFCTGLNRASIFTNGGIGITI